MPQERVDNLVAELRKALLLVDSTHLPDATTPLRELAHERFLRLRGQIRAVLAVATAKGVDGEDVEVVARPLLEGGITLGWVGEDDANVGRLRAHIEHQRDVWLQEFNDVANGSPLGRPLARDRDFPGVRQRAKQAGCFYAQVYGMSYPGMSAATHGLSDKMIRAMQPGLVGVGNALNHALTGVAMILFWVGVTFDRSDLRDAANDLLSDES